MWQALTRIRRHHWTQVQASCVPPRESTSILVTCSKQNCPVYRTAQS